jgi:hypothetical protein
MRSARQRRMRQMRGGRGARKGGAGALQEDVISKITRKGATPSF